MLLALPWFCYASIYLWKCPRLAAGATLPLALCVEWKVVHVLGLFGDEMIDDSDGE
jgi:hypothetical protein